MYQTITRMSLLMQILMHLFHKQIDNNVHINAYCNNTIFAIILQVSKEYGFL